MAIAVRETFTKREAHVEESLRILGASDQKWQVFLAVYRGKKTRKSVSEIAISSGLSEIQVLNVGKALSRGGLFEQSGRNPTEYVKIEEIAHVRDRIIKARSAEKPVRKISGPDSASYKKPKRSDRPSESQKISLRKTGKANAKKLYDVFISHASEDKKTFVQALANRIKSEGIRVWYDKFTLKWGDGLRDSIDHGLSQSRFGIVVLSPDFLKKPWTKQELNGLFELEIAGRARILPIWHNLTHSQVLDYSPTLAGRLALHSNHPVDDMIDQLRQLLDD
jgi:hypothetical protein